MAALTRMSLPSEHEAIVERSRVDISTRLLPCQCPRGVVKHRDHGKSDGVTLSEKGPHRPWTQSLQSHPVDPGIDTNRETVRTLLVVCRKNSNVTVAGMDRGKRLQTPKPPARIYGRQIDDQPRAGGPNGQELCHGRPP